MSGYNVIKKQDYEHYIVPLPVKQLVKGNSYKYIYGQLENLHPCFSNDWYFSSRIKLNKNGLCSDVLVINKIKLADYKKGLFFFENYPGGRFIFSRKQKIITGSLILFLSILCLFFLLLWNFKTKNEKQLQLDKNQTIDEIDESIFLTHERKEIINNFFNQMEKTGGKIESIDWSCDGYEEKIFVKVTGVFPKSEGITKKITYKNGIPEFTVELSDFCNASNVQNRKLSNQFCEKMRNVLTTYNIIPENENLENYKVSFKCEKYYEKKSSNFFIDVNELCKNENMGISKISLQKISNSDGSEGFCGEISVNPKMEFVSGINVESFGWRTNLMFANRKFYSEKRKVTTSEVSIDNPEITKGIKLGEVIHSDGSRNVYYKTNEGKIIWTN